MLTIRNISCRIRHKMIAENISFKASPGELVVVIGPNGAGKSTLLKMISGSIAPTSGTIEWCGVNMRNNDPRSLSTSRAVFTQNIQLSQEFEVKEVVMMGRYPHFDQVPSTSDHTIVNDELRSSALHTFATRSYATLSGGEQQRTQLSRVMVQLKDPAHAACKLLLLDEPLNNLDIRHQHACMQRARDFAKAGNVVIAVLHDINIAAQFADRILIVKNGRNCAFGNVDEVMTEELLSACFDFPAAVVQRADQHSPVIVFGEQRQASEKIFVFDNIHSHAS